MAKTVEVVGILVAAGNGEDAGAQDVDQAVPDTRRVTRVAYGSRQLLGQLQAPFGSSQKHDPAIRGDAPTVERSRYLLASDGWKRERRQRIVGHGGCGSRDVVGRTGLSNRILRQINRLCYIRQPCEHALMHKTG